VEELTGEDNHAEYQEDNQCGQSDADQPNFPGVNSASLLSMKEKHHMNGIIN